MLDPNVSVPTHRKMQLRLQNAAIFGTGMPRRTSSNALSFKGLHGTRRLGSRVALTTGCASRTRRVFEMLKAVKAGGDKSNASGDLK
jgi:hypothetical protein